MGSDDERRDRRSRRSHDDDQDTRPRRDAADRDSHRRRRSKDRDHRRDRGSDRHRDRRRSRSRDDRERRRSRTPDSSLRKRSRSRDRDRDRDRDGDGDGDGDRNRARDRDRDRRRRRSASASGGKELARRRHHRRRDSDRGSDSEHEAPRRKRPAPAPTAGPLLRAGPLPDQEASFAVSKGEEPEKPKEKPNLRTTGLLAAASNSVQQADGTSIVLKYHEPAEARKPPAKDQWRLFVFKGADIVDTVDLSARSCWLVGREAAVVDLAAEHPSISKQHAVIQFRHVEKRNEFGDRIGKVKPYLIDLESANGTVLNGDKIADSRYYELRDKDMIKLGHSTREYVLMLAPKE